MYHHQRKTSTAKIINSKIFLIFTLLVLVGVSFGLFKIIYRRIQIKKEITAVEERIETLKNDSSNLVRLLDYLDTKTYKEETARVELGLKKPDETVVVITKKTDNTQLNQDIGLPLEEKKEIKISNPKKWWQYFFEN